MKKKRSYHKRGTPRPPCATEGCTSPAVTLGLWGACYQWYWGMVRRAKLGGVFTVRLYLVKHERLHARVREWTSATRKKS